MESRKTGLGHPAATVEIGVASVKSEECGALFRERGVRAWLVCHRGECRAGQSKGHRWTSENRRILWSELVSVVFDRTVPVSHGARSSRSTEADRRGRKKCPDTRKQKRKKLEEKGTLAQDSTRQLLKVTRKKIVKNNRDTVRLTRTTNIPRLLPASGELRSISETRNTVLRETIRQTTSTR